MKKQFKTRLMQISVDALRVDTSYQRAFKKSWAQDIAQDLDPDLFGELRVSERKKGEYWIFDGQHRAAAVRMVPGLAHSNVPCIVYEGLGVADEAKLFRFFNRNLRVREFDKFRADLVRQDPEAIAIDAICREHGLPLSQGTGFTCLSAVQKIHRGIKTSNRAKGPANLKATLRTIVSAWGNGPHPPVAGVVLGLGTFLERYAPVDMDRLVTRLARWTGGWTGLLGKARGWRDIHGGALTVAVLELILTEYNRGLRKGQLPPYRKDLKETTS